MVNKKGWLKENLNALKSVLAKNVVEVRHR